MLIRTRFAPSPTGYLHVGGLRTALYQYLFAKNQGGKFLLRIEDTDRERFVADGTENILKSLYWAGIVPDEGVCLDDNGKVSQSGEFGPYVQSERLTIYKKYSDELIQKGSAYHCFCSAERLEKLRETQQKNKQPTGYDQFCLKNVNSEAALQRVVAGERHVVRLKMPKEGQTVFNDLIRGEIKFKNILVDDQVLIKSDGFPTYHLAVVVDDHLMQITHVIRGDEWISSTPKHIQLYKCFGWKAPEFAHLPLLLNADKSKLSKRQGDVAVSEYQKNGYLPEALINFVAFLGWNPGDEREIFSLQELIKEFNISKVNKTGAIFNVDKLNWFNKEYIKKLSVSELAEKSLSWFGDGVDLKKLERMISLERERVTTLAELPGALAFAFKLPDYTADQLVWRKGSVEEVRKILPELHKFLSAVDEKKWNKAELEKLVGEWVVKNGFSNGSVLWPLRVALSGQANSPGPFEIAEALGRLESMNRIETAIRKL